MKPIGHDGKQISDHAWRRAHAIIAKIEERMNARPANEQKGA